MIPKHSQLYSLAWPGAATPPGTPGLPFLSLLTSPGPCHCRNRSSPADSLVPNLLSTRTWHSKSSHFRSPAPPERLTTKTAVWTLKIWWFITHAQLSYTGWLIPRTGTLPACSKLGQISPCTLKTHSFFHTYPFPPKDTGLHGACPGLNQSAFPKIQDKKLIPAFSKLFYFTNYFSSTAFTPLWCLLT